MVENGRSDPGGQSKVVSPSGPFVEIPGGPFPQGAGEQLYRLVDVPVAQVVITEYEKVPQRVTGNSGRKQRRVNCCRAKGRQTGQPPQGI